VATSFLAGCQKPQNDHPIKINDTIHAIAIILKFFALGALFANNANQGKPICLILEEMGHHRP
jgi:hypothetical protein